MTEIDLITIEVAKGIMNTEGYKGVYDGVEASLFWKAERAIEEALRIVKVEEEKR